MFPLLDIVHNEVENTYYVVNIFDGVVIGEFYTSADAEDFAISEQYNEAHRINIEYAQ